jgi:hypothetical protein
MSLCKKAWKNNKVGFALKREQIMTIVYALIIILMINKDLVIVIDL